MKIRRAKSNDAKNCLKLQKLDKERYWRTEDFKRAAKHRDVVFVVAEENKKIVGYSLGFIVPTRRTDAMVHETRVDKRQRYKKIGTKLVNELCRQLFKKGAKEIFAEIEPKLLNFYVKSCKFKKSGKWLEVKRLK